MYENHTKHCFFFLYRGIGDLKKEGHLSTTMRACVVKRLDNKKSDDSGGCYTQTGFPPEQWVTGYEAKVSEMSMGMDDKCIKYAFTVDIQSKCIV